MLFLQVDFGLFGVIVLCKEPLPPACAQSLLNMLQEGFGRTGVPNFDRELCLVLEFYLEGRILGKNRLLQVVNDRNVGNWRAPVTAATLDLCIL